MRGLSYFAMIGIVLGGGCAPVQVPEHASQRFNYKPPRAGAKERVVVKVVETIVEKPVEKIVEKVVEKRVEVIVEVVRTQTCTRIEKPLDVCLRQPSKNSSQVTSCAEAYYLLTICKNANLDARPLGLNSPRWEEANGIPCQNRCGTSAMAMLNSIASAPYTPPLTTDYSCTPPT